MVSPATVVDPNAPQPITNPGASMSLSAQNIFAPEKKKRNRAGYAEGDYTLFRQVPIKEFVMSNALDAVVVLSTCNQLSWTDETEKKGSADQMELMWRQSRHTTDEVLEHLRDLKVLGKGDFKRLMKWRVAVRLDVSAGLGRDAGCHWNDFSNLLYFVRLYSPLLPCRPASTSKRKTPTTSWKRSTLKMNLLSTKNNKSLKK